MPASVPALHILFSSDASQDRRDAVTASLLDFETAAVHEVSDTEWRVFFRSADERDRAGRALSHLCQATPTDIEDEDWARRSQQDLKALQVGNLIIAPPWDVPSVPRRRALIIIEPSTGFGTGHHPTTRLCLRALQRIDLRGKRVLDAGTGSGLLAIAAARLGAASVIAIDNDPDAIDAARRNAERNGVVVDVRVVNLESEVVPAADVVVANLTGALLLRTVERLSALAPGGVLIVSGLLDDEEAGVAKAFSPYVSRITADHERRWAALTMEVPQAARGRPA